MASYNVTCTGTIKLACQETPSSGALNGIPVPLTETITFALQTTGTAADKVDGIYFNVLTFVASTPQTLDLTALTDPIGNSLTCARVRLIAFKPAWTTDNVPLLIGGAGANEWSTNSSPIQTNAAKIAAFPSSAAGNNGFTMFAAPQTTGMVVDSTHKNLKLDPQTAAGTCDVLILMCSA
jgi:hypothetical protein